MVEVMSCKFNKKNNYCQIKHKLFRLKYNLHNL